MSEMDTQIVQQAITVCFQVLKIDPLQHFFLYSSELAIIWSLAIAFCKTLQRTATPKDIFDIATDLVPRKIKMLEVGNAFGGQEGNVRQSIAT